jgi:hypothetical protein
MDPSPGEVGKSKPEDEEGPFAPKGKTGKLRDEAPAPIQGPSEDVPFPEKPSNAGLDLVYGFGKFVGSDPNAGLQNAPTEASVVSILVGATYDLKRWGIRLRVPLVTGKITEPGVDAYNSAALGNIEVAIRRIWTPNTHTKLPVELALTAPTAGGDLFAPPSDLAREHRFQANSAAQVARGMEEDALFAPHRFGMVPAASLQYQRGAILASGFAKIPIMIRAGGEDPRAPAPGQPVLAKINSVVVEGVFGGSFRYALLHGRVDVGARAWLAYIASEFIDTNLDNATKPTKLQVVLEPSVRGAFGRVRAGLGFIWPVGGRLGSEQQIAGLRISAAYVF